MTSPFRVRSGGPIDEWPRGSARAMPMVGDPGAQPAGWMVTRAVPEESAPPGSRFFAQSDAAAIAGAGAVLVLGAATLAIDPANYAVLRSIDLFVTNYTSASDVRFAVLFDGAPAPGLDNIGLIPANLAIQSRGFDLALAVPRAAVISVRATDNDGGAYEVGCTFFGWQWPAAIDARYRPEGQGVR